MTAPRRLLWIDDDGPRHYLYELHRLRALGWEVRWATSAADAAAALAADPFDAALLDQLLPLAPATDGVAAARSVWGGALLAAHLRDPGALAGLPAAVRAAAQPLLAPPLAANRGLPLLVVSAFDDPEVDELLARPGLAHPRLGPLRRVPKPVDFDDLQSFLDEALQTADPAGAGGEEEAATVRATPPEAR